MPLISDDDKNITLNLFYYSEKKENCVQIESYIYCPFMFINSSGFNLELQHKLEGRVIDLLAADNKSTFIDNTNYFYGHLRKQN
jgi:hypothetical protein